MSEQNLGNKVTVTLDDDETIVYRNVTKIHYNFEHLLSLNFEVELKLDMDSDIHDTGCTLKMDDIVEFETCLETEKAEEFFK